MRLKKTRTCRNCMVYEEYCNNGHTTGYCSLGFKTEPIEDSAFMYGKRELWGISCKPKEPCPKPLTIAEEIKCKNKYF